jgi:amidohydrolase
LDHACVDTRAFRAERIIVNMDTLLKQLDHLIEAVLPTVVSLRRDLHQHPELSRQEFRTAERVREHLAGLAGLQVLPAMLETDVVAVLQGGDEGPCLAIRADMDALPVAEETHLPHASVNANVMHACGHDGHTAILVGTAMVLSKLVDQLPGCVKFIFQPDEEDIGSAKLLCERGVLSSPNVDGIIALHGWPGQDVGKICVFQGPCMAANNPFEIVVRGKGAHGAYPHRGVDPIVVASQIVVALQSIVSRSVDPLDAAVVTVGHIHAGAVGNVIPDTCRLRGTLRYLRPETGRMLRDRVAATATQIARAAGADAEVDIQSGYPPMANDGEMSKLLIGTAAELFGQGQVVTNEPASMGVEDFSFYAEHVPAVMYRLGLRPVGDAQYPSLHSAKFDFNDDAIATGIKAFCAFALRYMHWKGRRGNSQAG